MLTRFFAAASFSAFAASVSSAMIKIWIEFVVVSSMRWGVMANRTFW